VYAVVDAMPYVNFRKRTGGFAKRDAKRQRKSGLLGSSNNFRSLVRKELLRTTETKMKTYYTGMQNLYHNTWYSDDAMSYISQGDGKEHRGGDEVFLRMMVTKLHINSKPDRQASMIRALLVRVPADKGASPAADLLEGGTNGILNFVNTNECAILAQKIVRMQGTTVWDNGTVKKDLNQSVVLKYNFKNQKTRYDGNYPKFFTIRLLVLAYDSHGTLTSDNIADFMMVSRLYFKDP
jgi:hypothetical protein